MQTSRRLFLGFAALGLAELGLRAESFVTGKSPMKLGTVTCNLARSWDSPTIIRRCSAAKLKGVELRAIHGHKVELNLTKAQRSEVKKQFNGSPVDLMGMGSAYDYHTPDQAKLRRDIEATKQYLQLAHDVGAEGIKNKEKISLKRTNPKVFSLRRANHLKFILSLKFISGMNRHVSFHSKITEM